MHIPPFYLKLRSQEPPSELIETLFRGKPHLNVVLDNFKNRTYYKEVGKKGIKDKGPEGELALAGVGL